MIRSRLLLFLIGLGCGGQDTPPAPSGAVSSLTAVPGGTKGPLVLLVSWDTTRADALGCYGAESHWGLDLEPSERPRPHTPTADALAASGVRVQWALSHAPTTLNSHTSVFSGRDPHGHRVPRNGFPVPPDVPLLTERFADAGWDTIAVVGASVLERDMGISRGFRIYDDAVGTRVRHRFEDPAERVVDRVLRAVDTRPDPSAPLMLFSHFFDAHSPWDTASDAVRSSLLDPAYRGPFDGSGASMDWLIKATRRGITSTADRKQARAAYLAEVAYADQQLGRLLEALSERGYGSDQLVVLFGDHGETLDERPERPYQHGLDVDLVDIHVPLIFSGSGRFTLPASTVHPGAASLRDVGPTVLSIAGLPGGLGDGLDLRSRWGEDTTTPPVPQPHFAEATKPGTHETPTGWNNLRFARAVIEDGHMYRTAAVLDEPPTLHRLAPGQPEVLDTDRATSLQVQLEDWDARAPERRTVSLSPQTREALQALGYIDEDGP